MVDFVWELHEGTHSLNAEIELIEFPKAIQLFINGHPGWHTGTLHLPPIAESQEVTNPYLTEKLKPYLAELNSTAIALNALKLGGLHADCKCVDSFVWSLCSEHCIVICIC